MSNFRRFDEREFRDAGGNSRSFSPGDAAETREVVSSSLFADLRFFLDVDEDDDDADDRGLPAESPAIPDLLESREDLSDCREEFSLFTRSEARTPPSILEPRAGDASMGLGESSVDVHDFFCLLPFFLRDDVDDDVDGDVANDVDDDVATRDESMSGVAPVVPAIFRIPSP